MYCSFDNIKQLNLGYYLYYKNLTFPANSVPNAQNLVRVPTYRYTEAKLGWVQPSLSLAPQLKLTLLTSFNDDNVYY